MSRYLVIQTAFIGDAVLTLPVVQLLKKVEPDSSVDVVVTPRTAELFQKHPAVEHVILFDKKGSDRGFSGLQRVARQIRSREYNAAIIPHRSMRSALLGRLGKIPVRIGFDRSAGWFLMTKSIRYDPKAHEVDRNLSLLAAIGINSVKRELPEVFPSSSDVARVDSFLAETSRSTKDLVGLAPGSVWRTKRWLEDRYTKLAGRLVQEGFGVALVGGKEDESLCQGIKVGTNSSDVFVAAGKLPLLQSAELIRRCRVLVSNDSAPMHMALAMRTPVVAIYGSTAPEFGFAPYGDKDVVVQTNGLPCRPCSIHGSQKCPIKTFECMNNISVDQVYQKVKAIVG